MAAYYNEFDPFAAAWLRELIKARHIPSGEVDERDMREVQPEDLHGFTQYHWFAGIGGWAYAARLAGWPDDMPLWTGSPPCQPFSNAGKRLGAADERHLAPHWLELVKAFRPPFVAGEQVAAAINKDAWLDDLLDALEAEDYATGAIVLPACGVGSPHIRQRIFFVGRSGNGEHSGPEGLAWHGDDRHQPRRVDAQPSGSVAKASAACGMADAGLQQRPRPSACGNAARGRDETTAAATGLYGDSGMADSEVGRVWTQHGEPGSGLRQKEPNRGHGSPVRMADAMHSGRPERRAESGSGQVAGGGESCERASPLATGWHSPDWLLCRDGKWRPVESGTFPLANGVSSRVGRLRGYGNAIVPQVAAEVLKELSRSTYL